VRNPVLFLRSKIKCGIQVQDLIVWIN
jgi:hypothetical protein